MKQIKTIAEYKMHLIDEIKQLVKLNDEFWEASCYSTHYYTGYKTSLYDILAIIRQDD